MDAAELARAGTRGGSRRAGGGTGVGRQRARRIRSAALGFAGRARLPLAGRRPHAARHRQERRGRAQRAARHRRGRSAGHPAGRGQRALLLLVPARDLRRAAPSFAAGDRRGAQPVAEDPAHARPAQDPALHDLRGGRGGLRDLSPGRAGDHLGRRVPARRREIGHRRRRAGAARCVARTRTFRSSCTRRSRRTKRWPRAWGRASCSRDRRSCSRTSRRCCSRTSVSAISSSGCPTATRWAAPPTCASSRRSWRGRLQRRSPITRRATISRAGSRRAPSSRSPTSCGRGGPEDYASVEALRQDLIRAIGQYRETRSLAVVDGFRAASALLCRASASIASAAARWAARRAAWPSCAAARRLATCASATARCEIAVPTAVVLGTDVFDRFLDENDLRRFRALLRGRRGDRAPLPRRAASRRTPSATCRPSSPRRATAAGGALVEPARGFPAPAVHRRLRDVHAAQRPPGACEARLRAALPRRSSASTPRRSRAAPRTTYAPRPTASRRRRWR